VWVQRPERNTDYMPPSCPEVKNEWSCISTPPLHLRGVYRDNFAFIGAFTKFWKATVSFVMSVRLSAQNNSASTGWIFMKFDIRVFLQTLSRNLKFH
jgi:hypothetical protein